MSFLIEWIRTTMGRLPAPLRMVLLLAALVLLLLPPYLAFAGRPDPNRSMEKICMLTSQETWYRLRAGEAGAWKTPSLNGGVPRIEKPPLLVWLNLLAWRDLDPATATVEDLAGRARAVTSFLVMLAVVAACWGGCTLGGRRAGLLAGLVTGSMFLAVKQGHYATYDPQVMGWAALAVAAGLWAIQPVRPEGPGRRHLWGWLIAGVAMGGGVMTKGPMALAHVLLPLGWVLAFTPWRRVRNIAGLLAAVAVCGALSAWWYWHAAHVVAGADSRFAQEYLAKDLDQRRPIYQYLLMVGFVFPWTLWWILSWFQPFRKAESAAVRRPALLAWGWFFTAFTVTALWPMRNERYLAPLLPAAGVMCALWLSARHEQFRSVPAPTWLRRIWDWTWIVLAVVAALALPFFLLHDRLLARGVLKEPLLAGVSPLAAVAAALALLGLCWGGWRLARRQAYMPAAALLGVWMVVFTTLGYAGYSQSPSQQYVYRADAERLADACRGVPAVVLKEGGTVAQGMTQGFRIYMRRVIPSAGLPDVEKMISQGRPLAVIAAAGPETEGRLAALGLRRGIEAADKRQRWVLFRWGP